MFTYSGVPITRYCRKRRAFSANAGSGLTSTSNMNTDLSDMGSDAMRPNEDMNTDLSDMGSDAMR